MPENKTKPTAQTPEAFLNNIEDETLRDDCFAISNMMQQASGLPPVMWGTAIVGFGKYHYKYDSGREGEICLIGFSPRKQNITLYVLCGFPAQEELLSKLGKHKTGGGCLYIKKLKDVDNAVLQNLIRQSFLFRKKEHGQ
jgi:hypothetical protein